MKLAAAYVRASTDRQENSTKNQMDMINDYAQRNGYRVVEKYEDAGYSGLDLHGRPALRQLLHDALNPDRGFNVLLIYDISRWGRFQDPDEGAYYEVLCRHAGIEVIYCAEPFNELEAPGFSSVLKGIKRAMAAEFSRELSEKVLAAQRRTVLQGFHRAGTANYGLRRLLVPATGAAPAILEVGETKALQSDKVVLVPGPINETEVVNRIFRLCADEGLGASFIAKRLNFDRVPAPSGGLWQPCTIHKMLRNEKYLGTIVYGRTQSRLKSRKIPLPPSEWLRVPGAFEGIVDQNLFARAQKRLIELSRRPTDTELLNRLTELYQRHGMLTSKMIKRDPDTHSTALYCARFGSIRNAYRMIGLTPTTKGHLPNAVTADVLLKNLRDIWTEHGRLSRSLIASTKGVPGPGIYRSRFGSLSAAFALIGYQTKKKPITRFRELDDSEVAAPTTPSRLAGFGGDGS